MGPSGQIVGAGPDTCVPPQPTCTALCWPEAALSSCRLAADNNIPSTVDADCNGHGLCGAAGCECKDGWHGQFCEVSPRCRGVMDRHDRCCASGVLNVTGECCPPGSVLDAAGACCSSGQVDVCGVCGGASWTVDVRVRPLELLVAQHAWCPPASYSADGRNPADSRHHHPFVLLRRVPAVHQCWMRTGCAAPQGLLMNVGCVTGTAPAAACTCDCCCRCHRAATSAVQAHSHPL